MIKTTKRTKLIMATAVCVALAGCESTGGIQKETGIGTAVGAVAGAVIGKQVGGKKGMLIGAAAGGLAGAAIGSHMAKQRQALEQGLAKEIKNGKAGVSEVKDASGAPMIRVELDGTATFPTNSATVRPEFLPTIQRIADVAAQQGQSVVHVIGHTDSQGGVDYNMSLSKRRAEAVAQEITSRGMDGRYVLPDGRGPLEPIASNATESGRAKNRRVEIYLRPIEEGKEQLAFESPRFKPAM